MNPLKKLLVLPVLAALGLSCASDTAAVRLLGARPLPFGPEEVTACEPTGDTQQLGGRLDVAPLGAGTYFIAFGIASSLEEPTPDTVGGNPLGGSGANDFILEEVRLSYSSEPDLNIPESRQALFGTFPAGAEDGFIAMNLISAEALAALRGQALPVNGLTLMVTVQVAGELGSGRDIESNEVTYSITVRNSGTSSCPAGQVRVPSGPCNDFGGQDNAPICDVPPTT